MNQMANQIKYGLIKAANFAIDQPNHDQKKMVQKRIQHTKKENLLLLLLLKDLLERQKIKFINT